MNLFKNSTETTNLSHTLIPHLIMNHSLTSSTTTHPTIHNPITKPLKLTQRWIHQMEKIEKMTDSHLENVIGRTKEDSIELEPLPATSHVSRMTTGWWSDVRTLSKSFNNFSNQIQILPTNYQTAYMFFNFF